MDETKFLEERPGVKSTMRLMSFISLVNGSAMSWYALITGQINMNLIVLISLFVVGAFVPKALQKYAENLNLK